MAAMIKTTGLASRALKDKSSFPTPSDASPMGPPRPASCSLIFPKLVLPPSTASATFFVDAARSSCASLSFLYAATCSTLPCFVASKAFCRSLMFCFRSAVLFDASLTEDASTCILAPMTWLSAMILHFKFLHQSISLPDLIFSPGFYKHEIVERLADRQRVHRLQRDTLIICNRRCRVGPSVTLIEPVNLCLLRMHIIGQSEKGFIFAIKRFETLLDNLDSADGLFHAAAQKSICSRWVTCRSVLSKQSPAACGEYVM